MTDRTIAAVPLRILAIIWASPYTALGLLIGIVGVCTGDYCYWFWNHR